MVVPNEAALLAQLRPRIDGLLIKDGQQGALFLPSVWEQLPDAPNFLRTLKNKAGMAPDHWSPTFQAWRFQAVEVK
jgi:AMMECR1 domain-containing protein